MKMTLIALNYQRNGVCGEGFFVAVTKNISDTKGVFLTTFSTVDDVDQIDPTTCRVIMLEGRKNPHYQCWRGDRISTDIANLLNELKEKHNVNDWYDLHTIFENKATGSKLPVKSEK